MDLRPIAGRRPAPTDEPDQPTDRLDEQRQGQQAGGAPQAQIPHDQKETGRGRGETQIAATAALTHGTQIGEEQRAGDAQPDQPESNDEEYPPDPPPPDHQHDPQANQEHRKHKDRGQDIPA